MATTIDHWDQRPPDPAFSVRATRIDSFEQLRAATPSSTSEIIQVEVGQMRGRLKHATLAGLALGFGTFSRGLISRGVYSNEHITIGFLTDADIGRPGHIRIWPPGMEHERRHRGSTSFGAISVSTGDMSSFFGPHSRFGDPSFWRKRNILRVDPRAGAATAEALRSIIIGFESRSHRITPGHAEYWKRAILEATTAAIADTDAADMFVPSPVKLVRRAQEVLDRAGSRPVHMSELTKALGVSRRSLHRAFDDIFGTSPMAYLRHTRLCEARTMLRQQADTTVADVAFSQGFADFGRFSKYYRSLFGEYPSETLASARARS